MPVPTNNSRPNLPYNPAQSLPNNERFGLLGQRPPTAQMMDAEFNALTDDVNILAQAINDVQAGSIPGSDSEQNANKMLTTDGQGNLSFTLVDSYNIAPEAVIKQNIAPQAVTTSRLENGSVTNEKIRHKTLSLDKIAPINPYSLLVSNDAGSIVSIKGQATQVLVVNPTGAPVFSLIQEASIADLNVTTAKIADLNVTTAKIANSSVTTGKIANEAVTQALIAPSAVGMNQLMDAAVVTAKVADQAIGASKMNSGATPAGYPLISNADTTATYQPVPTEGIADNSITFQKLHPTVAQGVVIAAGVFTGYGGTLSNIRSFGTTSIAYYTSGGNYWFYRVTYSTMYPNSPILVVSQNFQAQGYSPYAYPENGNTGILAIVNTGAAIVSFHAIAV